MKQASRLAWSRWPSSAGESRGGAANDGEFPWLRGGRLNGAYICVDRHAAIAPDRTALIWAKKDPEEYESVSFSQLQARVGRLANALRALGVGRGDRVCLYLPMMPELCYAMLACARIGAVHSVVATSLNEEVLRRRVLSCTARVVIVADEGLQGSERIALKAVVDAALDGVHAVHTVLVARRTGVPVGMRAGRDRCLSEAMAEQRAEAPIEWMDCEEPLFVVDRAGAVGRSKDLVHPTGGYLLHSAVTQQLAFDSKPGDLQFCGADIGGVAGHSYIVYGPLCNGSTTVLFESSPHYPDATRFWQVIDQLGATVLYTSPAALRALMREGNASILADSSKSLRVLGAPGEPPNPETWIWYHEIVAMRRPSLLPP